MPIVPWKKSLNAWVLLAAVGSASALSLFPTHAAQAQSAPMQRTLPDFTDLVDQVGPSVVNIRTLEKVSGRQGAGTGMDEDMLEFFRRFGLPVPQVPRQAPKQQRPQPEE